jgi:hypothetical protein
VSGRLLLDTNILIWWLSATVHTLADPTNLISFSAVNLCFAPHLLGSASSMPERETTSSTSLPSRPITSRPIHRSLAVIGTKNPEQKLSREPR